MAFGILSTERYPAMSGISPIPFTAILAYAQYAEYARNETEIFVNHVLAIDRIFVDWKNAEAAKRSASK